jgi:regulatory protein
MSTITGIKAAKTREKRINIYLDGKPAVSLLKETALKEGLRQGQEITENGLVSLIKSDACQRCYNAAVRLLSYRPRSEAEIRQRLTRKLFDSETLEKTITKLKGLGFIDDTAFARFWKENRQECSPRSRRLTSLELRRKGLDRDIIEQVVGELDDSDNAYRAALKRAHRLTASEYQEFRKRLGSYLGRRGFSYSVIDATTKRVWQESKNTLKQI